NPLGGRVSWLPRNSFYLPSYHDLDMRLSKDFTVRERYHFEIRWEAFNVFNSTMIQSVSNNMVTLSTPSAASTICPSSIHGTNVCAVPITSFQTPTVTSTSALGARQIQFGGRVSL